MERLKIEGTTSVKDSYSSAMLSTDKNKLLMHREMKKAKQQDAERINKLENEVSEIKTMLQFIVDKLK